MSIKDQDPPDGTLGTSEPVGAPATPPADNDQSSIPKVRGRRLLRFAGVGALFAFAALSGTLIGLYLAVQNDLPLIEQLENYEPSIVSQVMGDDGEVVAEFFVEKRVVIGYEDLPEHLKDALIAFEDQRFMDHPGFDWIGIARAMWSNILAWDVVSGASGITQQVSRLLFLNRSLTVNRKIQEAILAFKIEQAYTKEEILTFYSNLQHFGHGTYGFEAAADYYFGKSARDLTLAEAALIVGITPSPANFSPFVNRETALRRRAMVLSRMVEEGKITNEEADVCNAEPLNLKSRKAETELAAYFVEEVRQHLEATYGASRIYGGGLRVYTTLNREMQEAANTAVWNNLRAIDRRQGFRAIGTNVLEDMEISIEEFQSPDWVEPYEVGEFLTGVVTRAGNEPLVRVGRYEALLKPDNVAWTKRPLSQVLKVGDVTQFKVEAIREDSLSLDVELAQEPVVEGSFIAIEAKTGQIKAMVGGFDFERSKFNRATQAMRQPGSSFKAFAYAAAVENGFTPTSLLLDAPVRYEDPHIEEIYEPKNYDLKYEGWITMRRAMEGSRNVPAVRMTEQIGPDKVASLATRLGLKGPIPPYLSITLGSAEATLLEMASAYSAFANQGIRMQPYYITRVTDRDGNVLEENFPKAGSAIRADVAFIISNIMRGVVLRGTAVRASALGRPVGGKTGTTDDYTDAWFIGFDPDLVAASWIGFDKKITLGRGETGARAALPAWLSFMQTVLKDKPPQNFPVPSNIVFMPVDRKTGYPVDGPGNPNAITEAFIAGTEPAGYP